MAGCSIHIVPDIVIPPGIVDHDSFREWARSDSFPRRGRFAFYNGDVWTDLNMEQAYSHNDVKGEYNSVLRPIAKRSKKGRYFTDGMLLTNTEVGFTTIPDGFYVSFEALDAGVLREIGGKSGGCVEFVGTPDMTLEVVSKYSIEKDHEFLEYYYEGGVSEYWLIDATRSPIQFDIYRRNTHRFVRTRTQASGWLKSVVFERSFRLVQSVDERGKPEFTLEVRE